MTETLTGKQVLALLAQDEPPEIEHLYCTGNWYTLDAPGKLVTFFFNQKNKFRIKPAPPRRLSVTLSNGEVVSWPEPVREALKFEQSYFMSTDVGEVREYEWGGDGLDRRCLTFGNVHLTREAAQEHADALRKINTQGVV